MDIQKLFPQGKIVTVPAAGDSYVYLPIKKDQWLELGKENLTDRELLLIQLLQEQELVNFNVNQSNWYRYLVSEKADLPVMGLSAVQFVYVKVGSVAGQEMGDWKGLLVDFLPNLIADFALDEDIYVFVLSQIPYMEVLPELAEMLPVLEFDIGVRLNVALGQVWPQELEVEWPQLFRAEWQLFVQTINLTEQSACKSFSQMIHENIGRNQSVSVLFLTRLARIIRQFDQMEETILAFWNEGAVLTKVAQQLYIHRNTLQYRLEKFYEQTGLNLKNMDDLALCYLALLS